MKKILITILLFISPIIFAEQQKTEDTSPQKIEQIVSQQIPKSYKDAFLGFVLEKAEKYTEKGEQAISKAVDLATVEAPILAKEYLRWNFWNNLIKFMIPASLFILFISITFFNLKKANFGDYSWNINATFVVSSLVGVVISFIATLACLDNLLIAIQIHLAPRVFIIEQVFNLVK